MIKFVERKVKSIDELKRRARQTSRPRQFDAYLYIADAMVASQAQHIIDSARDQEIADDVSRSSFGRERRAGELRPELFRDRPALGQVRAQILAGTSPGDLRVETIEDVELAFNLKTAKANRRDDPAERADARGEGGAVKVAGQPRRSSEGI